jgi:hypothetical protein
MSPGRLGHLDSELTMMAYRHFLRLFFSHLCNGKWGYYWHGLILSFGCARPYSGSWPTAACRLIVGLQRTGDYARPSASLSTSHWPWTFWRGQILAFNTAGAPSLGMAKLTVLLAHA